MKPIIAAVILLFMLTCSAMADPVGRRQDPKEGPGETKQIDQGLPTKGPDAAQPEISSPDDSPPFQGGSKLLLPAVKEYRIELAKARFKMKRFDLSKGNDLVILTTTKVSIPAMKEIVEGMIQKASDIKDAGFREKMIGYIKNLEALLESQENNRTDKDGMTDAFNQMEEILDQMESPTQ